MPTPRLRLKRRSPTRVPYVPKEERDCKACRGGWRKQGEQVFIYRCVQHRFRRAPKRAE
jgi:hypothetical protein